MSDELCNRDLDDLGIFFSSKVPQTKIAAYFLHVNVH